MKEKLKHGEHGGHRDVLVSYLCFAAAGAAGLKCLVSSKVQANSAPVFPVSPVLGLFPRTC